MRKRQETFRSRSGNGEETFWKRLRNVQGIISPSCPGKAQEGRGNVLETVRKRLRNVQEMVGNVLEPFRKRLGNGQETVRKRQGNG